jgi:hypothetical protein
MPEAAIDAIIDAVVALIRQEAPRIIESGSNWKIVVNGAGGAVRIVVEQHHDVIRDYRPVIRN